MELRPVASYARAIRPHLPEGTFAPARSRLLWLPLHVAVIAVLAWSMSSRWLPGYLWPVAAIVIGLSLSGITFLGHEVLHGQIVRVTEAGALLSANDAGHVGGIIDVSAVARE